MRVVHNGVTAEEFAEIAPQADATDIVFVGELRMLKGVDVLLDALAQLAARGPRRQRHHRRRRARTRRNSARRPNGSGLAASVRFPGAMPARAAFALGRLMVAPSRAESLPYIILETAAAAVPLITTNVGGIPEVFGPQAGAAGSARRCRRAGAARSAPRSTTRRRCVTKR